MTMRSVITLRIVPLANRLRVTFPPNPNLGLKVGERLTASR
jgi:hypothetical protein